jgi:hypothetical protein
MNSRPPGLRPAADVGQPGERADAGEHQVVGFRAEYLDRVVHRRHVVVDRRAGALGEPARVRDRGVREVKAAHPRTQSGQRQRVRADVTLQVHAAQPGEVAKARPVEGHHLGQERRIGDQPLDLVIG